MLLPGGHRLLKYEHPHARLDPDPERWRLNLPPDQQQPSSCPRRPDWPARPGLTDDELDVVLNALIGELGDDHSYIDSPADVANEEAELAGQASLVGVGALFVAIPQSHRAVVVLTLGGADQVTSSWRS